MLQALMICARCVGQVFLGQWYEVRFALLQLQSCSDIFALFDTRGVGLVDAANLPVMIRSSDFPAGSQVDLSTFSGLIQEWPQSQNSSAIREELWLAFQVLDSDGCGKVQLTDLMHALGTLNCAFSVENFEEILKHKGPDHTEGRMLNFEEFADT
eukprot:Lankesteria_metandrocarpae@DN5367_c0_g1_i39.p2